MNSEPAQFILIEFYVNHVQIFYDKLSQPATTNSNFAQTFVSFQFLNYSKIEISENDFTDKSVKVPTSINKGASLLIPLLCQNIVNFYRDLGVTIQIKDKIKKNNTLRDIAETKINLSQSVTDLFNKPTKQNETQIKSFNFSDGYGKEIAFMKGFIRISSFPEPLITQFYFSDNVKDFLYHQNGYGENCTLWDERYEMSQAKLCDKMTKDANEENKEYLTKWKLDHEYVLSHNEKEKTGEGNPRMHIVNSILNTMQLHPDNQVNIFSSESTETSQNKLKNETNNRDSIEKTSQMRKLNIDQEGKLKKKKSNETMKEDGEVKSIDGDNECPSTYSEADVNKQGKVQSALEVVFSCSCMKNEKVEPFYPINMDLSLYSCSCKSKASMPKVPPVTIDPNLWLCACMSKKNENVIPPQNGVSILSCRCLKSENRLDQLKPLYSCICMNTNKATEQIKSLDLYSSMCKANTEENKEKESNPEEESYSCTCMIKNSVEEKLAAPDFYSCTCMQKSNDPVIKTIQIGSNLYSCTCMLPKIEKAFKPLTILAKSNPKSNKSPVKGIKLNPRVLYSCPCMLKDRILSLNDLEDERSPSCRCMHKIKEEFEYPIKLGKSTSTNKCPTSDFTGNKKFNEIMARQSQVSLYLCECKEKPDKIDIKTSDTKKGKIILQNTLNKLYSDELYQNCRNILNESLETKIKEIIDEEFKIHVQDSSRNVIAPNPPTPALLVQKFKENDLNTDSENLDFAQSNSDCKHGQDSEVATNNKMDVFLLKISKTKEGSNQNNKIELEVRTPKQEPNLAKKTVNSNKNPRNLKMLHRKENNIKIPEKKSLKNTSTRRV